MSDFASRLILGTRDLGPLCVGIDPHPGRIPDLFGGDTPEGLAGWGEAVVAAAAGRVAVVKPSGDIIVTERSPTHQIQIYKIQRVIRQLILLLEVVFLHV